jgi:hypothetical protein
MQARHSELVFDLAGEFQRVIVGVLLVQLFDDQIARRPGFLDTEPDRLTAGLGILD